MLQCSVSQLTLTHLLLLQRMDAHHGTNRRYNFSENKVYMPPDILIIHLVFMGKILQLKNQVFITGVFYFYAFKSHPKA